MVSCQLIEQDIGNVPVLKCDLPAIIMKMPTTYPLCNIMGGNHGDCAMAITGNGAKLKILKSTPYQSHLERTQEHYLNASLVGFPPDGLRFAMSLSTPVQFYSPLGRTS